MSTKDIIIKDDLLLIEDGKFVYTQKDRDFIIRKVEERLLTVTGEDFQDIVKGLDLQGVMFNERATTSDIYSEVLRNVLLVEGVQEVIDIQIAQEKEKLIIGVSFVYNKEELTVEVTV